jgi:hypothetical protein
VGDPNPPSVRRIAHADADADADGKSGPEGGVGL